MVRWSLVRVLVVALTLCRFLYQGRELSYTSILDRSISSRRQALYSSKGLDIDRWMDLINERKLLQKNIEDIRGEYEGRHGKEDPEEHGGDSDIPVQKD